MLYEKGIPARIFHPLPWNLLLFHHAHIRETLWKQWPAFLWNINKRDHRKLCIIDNRIAWVGSFNITSEHFGPHRKKPWKDLAIRVEDPNVAKLKQSFDHIWHRVTDRVAYRKRLRRFFSNHTRQLRKEKNRQLINRIDHARTRVWITNAYFSPSYALLAALHRAHQRGVSVRLIVPAHSDIFLFPALSSTYYADLLKAGVRIYEYRESILHEKSLLIDDLAIIGSTNLNYRSWFHDLELDIMANQPDTIQQLDFHFIEALRHCREITAPSLQRYPRNLLWLGWFSRLFRYWL
jgi:cardiolipin synthase